MNDRDLTKVLKQVCNKTPKSYGGFSLLILILAGVLFVIGKVTMFIINSIKKLIPELKKQKEDRLMKDVYKNKFMLMMMDCSNTVAYSIKKQINGRDGSLTQYIDFYAFDKETGLISNVNEFLYYITGKKLEMCTTRSELKNTIILRDTDFQKLQDTLSKEMAFMIKFRFV